jgi:NAD(P) transhydrogenase subunit beta
MTAIPQRIALSHAGGALAACLIGVSEYYRHGALLGTFPMGIIGLDVILGALTFTGSLMVAGKLQGVLPGYPITYKGQNFINISLITSILLALVYLIFHPELTVLFYSLVSLALLFGIFLVMPIGAADVPVVIALLNACAGLTGAIMGFMLLNRIQIFTGALDGASGFILSVLMCRAMNRSMNNILFGAFGKRDKTSDTEIGQTHSDKQEQAISVEDALQLFENAKSVIIVPGYGMASSQAQFAVRELADKLKSRGVSIKYAIHPVAGRLPGHMNVLLAEANVPYTELFDMDSINSEFQHADIALVIGANDVTNPAARTVKSSPIYGMPILNVDKAKTVIVCKRTMAPGFSGVENILYHQPNTWMLFGDAKDNITKLTYALTNNH